MKTALLLVAIVVIAAAIRQHLRYLGTRRSSAQDHQPLIYGPGVFHLIVYLQMSDDSDETVLAALREIKSKTEDELTWVYAGRVAANGEYSPQLGEIPWSACLLLQAGSRAQAEESLAGRLGAAIADFPETHVLGFDRPVLRNLLFPQVMGLRRLIAIARREPSHFPLVPREGELTMPAAADLAHEILRGENLNDQAAVVFNIARPGTAEQQKNDAAYVATMFGSMAEGGYGPIHLGDGVRVSGEAEFEIVALVYYPGVRFFGEMIQSDFFQSIIEGKQLADNQSTITVPVLDRL